MEPIIQFQFSLCSVHSSVCTRISGNRFPIFPLCLCVLISPSSMVDSFACVCSFVPYFNQKTLFWRRRFLSPNVPFTRCSFGQCAVQLLDCDHSVISLGHSFSFSLGACLFQFVWCPFFSLPCRLHYVLSSSWTRVQRSFSLFS